MKSRYFCWILWLAAASAWLQSSLAPAQRSTRVDGITRIDLSSDDYETTEELSSLIQGRRRPRRRPAAAPEAPLAAEKPQYNNYPSLWSNSSWPSTLPSWLLRALHPYPEPTRIQMQTLAAVCNSSATTTSLLGQSETGSGKTLAFLVPLLARLDEPRLSFNDFGKPHVCLLILAPTRELAHQIATTTQELLAHRPAGGDVVVWSGRRASRLPSRPPTVLVATPGRLLDYLTAKSHGSRGGGLVSTWIQNTPMLILDEADRLLEAYRPELTKLWSFVTSKQQRQTFLFSATLPRRKDMEAILPDHYACVTSQTLKAQQHGKVKEGLAQPLGGDGVSVTHQSIQEAYTMLPNMTVYSSGLLDILSQQDADVNKVMVFLPATWLVRWFCQAYQSQQSSWEIYELHSRRSAASRRTTLDAFGRASRGILFASDVAARGIDIARVDLVVQYGLPKSRELYLHRLGRTGRVGKKGSGLLVLLPFESDKMRRRTTGRNGLIKASYSYSSVDKECVQRQFIKFKPIAESAYVAFVAYYIGTSHAAMHGRILDAAEELANSIGIDHPPELPDSLIKEIKG